MNRDWRAEFEALRAQRGISPHVFTPEETADGLYARLVTDVQEYAMFMLDPDGRILSWNKGARRIKQYQGRDVVGRHFSMLYTAGDRKAMRAEKNLADALRHGQTEDVGWRRRKDGSEFWADVFITTITDDQGRLMGFAKVIRDLTAINEAAAHARDQEVRERLDHFKGQLLSLVSHELRTPLTAIWGYASLLDEGPVPLTDAQHEYVAQLQAAAETLSGTINNLIELTSLRAGRLHLEPRPLDFAEVVSGVVLAVQDYARGKHQWLANHVGANLPLVVSDPERLAQVLIQLLDNAVKFTPASGRIDISATAEAHEVRCTITDTGKGIAPEDIERIFEAFGQVDMSATRTEGGLGLGLGLSKQLIEALGGQLGIMSQIGRGTTVWFTLPIAAAIEPVEPETEHADQA